MMAGDVTIGRLALDIPGMDAAQAARLAEQIGRGLAGRSGAFDTLAVTLEERPGELAQRILAALHQRIG
jgi:hypothetical protein